MSVVCLLNSCEILIIASAMYLDNVNVVSRSYSLDDNIFPVVKLQSRI